jgi:hypothetical protein
MSVNYAAILKDLATWASAAKLAGGAFLHHVYTWLKAKWAKAEADAKAVAAKVEADAKAAAKKL